MAEITFELQLTQVTSKTRQLKGVWSCRSGIIFSIGRRIRGKRYRGSYRYNVRRTVTAMHGLDVPEELTRFCIEGINKTRND